MVDVTPSSDMDDLFNFGHSAKEVNSTQSVPIAGDVFPLASAPTQPGSRRAARQAQDASAAERPAASSRRAASAEKAVKRRRELSRPVGDRRAAARALREVEASQPATRKLRRSEDALLHSSMQKAPRKNPFSVLVTMSMVGGLFAVTALPAYALSTSTPETVEAKTTAAKIAESSSQSIIVGADVAAVAATRDAFQATTPAEMAARSRDQLRAANNAAYLRSGARELGDDYPWPYELRSFQGGGLSPLNYFYRECVDFVAWRINRDQGSYSAPFKWVWSNMTPYGGSASQWKYSWDAKGWPTSKTPIVGSVAWFGSANHVAYVKSVLDAEYVLIEEYNRIPGGYSQRTIPISEVTLFLYPPS